MLCDRPQWYSSWHRGVGQEPWSLVRLGLRVMPVGPPLGCPAHCSEDNEPRPWPHDRGYPWGFTLFWLLREPPKTSACFLSALGGGRVGRVYPYNPIGKGSLSKIAHASMRLKRSYSQSGTQHFQRCAEFLALRNRGLGPLAVTVMAVPLARLPEEPYPQELWDTKLCGA
jgi:hypothetical protein